MSAFFLWFVWEEGKGGFFLKIFVCFKVQNIKFAKFTIPNANALNENLDCFRISAQIYL